MSWWDAFLEIIYPQPPACRLCHRPRTGRRRGVQGELCSACWAAIYGVPLGLIGCPTCARFFSEGRTASSGVAAGGDRSCPECSRQTPLLAGAVATGLYAGRLREAIHRLKYQNERELARPLGHLLARRMLPLLPATEPLLLVPVPLHPRRREERGYNQAELIAQAVARELGSRVRLEPQLLQRRLETEAQTGLGREERLHNLSGAFDVAPQALGRLAGRSVLLIDDVVTTATTARECAAALQAGGSGPVLLGVVAAGRLPETAARPEEENR